ncbi:MAG: GTPase HflX [Chloroflexota bacterium]
MSDFYETKLAPERAYLVGMEVRGGKPLLPLEDSVEELALLAETAGLEVVGDAMQRLHAVDPATFIGSGKVNEIKEAITALDAKVVIFDDELTPRHQRELEKRFGEEINVLDRSALILDIFAQHARTHEGSLQVELAQYEYRLPRLTRQWTHLARQAGGGGARGGASGVGLRGPGETQLEVDRREINNKITKLKEDLEKVRVHRETHRRKRRRSGMPVVALVGYTNAGKSTLLQSLTGSKTYVADQLFATLDPLTRKTELPSSRKVLFSDTVGFIQKLPTTLVAAFRATLEEITEATLILHVVDVSHANVIEHIEAVEETLAEIDMPSARRILVWNKADLWHMDTPPRIPAHLREDYDAEVMISARKNTGIDALLAQIEAVLKASMYRVRLLVPYSDGDVVSMLYDLTIVEEQTHTADGVCMTVQVPAYLYERIASYQILEQG